MDKDEEKDLYIKAKLKDGNIPEKIDNLFNNSAKLIEDIEPPKKNKKLAIFKRVAAVAACVIVALGGGNIYATTQGYSNVFFMIKEWVAPLEETYGKDNILSDRDITISYKSIEIAKGIKMQINRLVVKDNEAKLYLKIDQSETKLDITPFTYVVKDEKGKEICNYTSTNKEMIYTEELKLNGLKKDAKKLELEVKQKDGTTLVKFDINLENKLIQVNGNEKELKKISEEEIKKYLSAFAFLNYEDDNLNTETADKEILENERKMFVAKAIAEMKDLEFYKGTTTMGMHYYDLIDTEIANDIMSSFTDIELEDDGLIKLWNTYFIKSEVDGKMRYVDMPHPEYTIGALCMDVTDIMYSNGIYTVTFTYCYPTSQDEIDNKVEDLPVYEMTLGLIINEDQTYSKYRVSSMMEAKLIEAGKDETSANKEEDKDTELSDYFILYNGMEISKNVGIQGISDMKITTEAKSKYNTTYYNYENGEYLGTTEGKFENETYEGVAQVENVKRIAISQKYNSIPRTYEKITELPKELKDMADYTTVDIQALDLDGDGQSEHIVCYTLNYKAGEIGDGEPVASSGIMLLDANYKKIADLVTLENGFWANIKEENNKVFLSIDDVDYIDIDNDGIMEVIIRVPQYEGTAISIIKYKNGMVEGETNIKASLEP